MSDTITIKLQVPYTLPAGDVAEEAVLRLLKVKERRELMKKFSKSGEDYAIAVLRTRMMRIGSLSGPVDQEIIEDLPTLVFDQLLEGAAALDNGYTDLEAFKSSEDYDRLFR